MKVNKSKAIKKNVYVWITGLLHACLHIKYKESDFITCNIRITKRYIIFSFSNKVTQHSKYPSIYISVRLSVISVCPSVCLSFRTSVRLSAMFSEKCDFYILFLSLIILIVFQVGTGDEFLDKLLNTEPGLEDGAVPDLKV